MSSLVSTTPIALSSTRTGTVTDPWFVQCTEYAPAQATFKPLVNGEEAFGAVYDAILAAKHSIDIICWGFQPSMYFRRGTGSGMRIGELLAQQGAAGVRVRLLCWNDDLHAAEWLSENMQPGNNMQSAYSGLFNRDNEDTQARHFDAQWYYCANFNNVTQGQRGDTSAFLPGLAPMLGKWIADTLTGIKAFKGVEFATRDFSFENRLEIAWRTWHGADAKRSMGAKVANSTIMGVGPTHHQKMVLIDYEKPELAFGFVMGHNMLDEYWDRDDHRSARQPARLGRNGFHPRQDISSRVSGPLLKHLNENFCQAWDDATGQQLGKSRAGVAAQLKLRGDFDTPVMAQVLRTQSEHGSGGTRDIEAMYLQAVNNACKFIYIENQYFRFPPLADKIVSVAQTLIKHGRDPAKYDPLYLFVVTNANEEGVGDGTVSTYRMLDTLGRPETIPGVAELVQEPARQTDLQSQYADATEQYSQANQEIMGAMLWYGDNPSATQQDNLTQARKKLAQAKAKHAELRTQMKAPGKLVIQNTPGLKVHVCSLVAPDSPPGAWEYVYVHAKLMIVDDVFTTLGSANINTRSMEADSELNICHENAEVTEPLRKRLWNLHTSGLGVGADDAKGQLDAKDAYKQWGKIIDENTKRQTSRNQAPYAPLVAFMYGAKKLTRKD